MNSSLAEINSRLKPIHPSVNNHLKRLIDIMGALLGLTLTSVIIIVVAISMAIFDRGPVFYSQMRCGLYGKPFRLWKIRSMVVNADRLRYKIHNEASGHFFKNANDSRITCLGKFLRRTSLDEFPQFWNVLRGDMSLVGTRPPTIDEVQYYQIHHWERLKVKPGITGEWQVHGRSKIKDFEEIVRLDLRYQSKWSIAYDLKLILRTILIVINGHGAF